MSRLDSFLRRMSAQRDGLNWLAEQVVDTSGDVIEMGLGNGRTYDHLREILTDRRIWVIDRALNCHHSCVPPEEDYIEADGNVGLEQLAARGVKAALAHYDFGIGNDALDQAESARMSPLIAAVMAPGGYIISGQPLVGFTEIDGPDTIAKGRYFFYQA